MRFLGMWLVTTRPAHALALPRQMPVLAVSVATLRDAYAAVGVL
jgi:hypothetical protein